MARQKGGLKLEGKIGDLSFYPSVFGDIVRRKGGPSKEKIAHGLNFVRVREQLSEFAACSKAGKVLRHALRQFILHAPDHTMNWRLNKLLNQVKDLDPVSIKGQRQVAKGLSTEGGKKLLAGMELNSKAPLKKVVKLPIEALQGKLHMEGLVTRRDLKAPKGATHVHISGILVLFDPENSKAGISSETLVLPLDNKRRNVQLHPEQLNGAGTLLYLVQLQFSQLVNQKQVILKNKEGNVLTILQAA